MIHLDIHGLSCNSVPQIGLFNLLCFFEDNFEIKDSLIIYFNDLLRQFIYKCLNGENSDDIN